MSKAIINKHIDNISELTNNTFVTDNNLSKGEIVICNDKDNPSIYIKNTEGEITKIAGGSNGDGSYDDTEIRSQINANTNAIKNLEENGVSVNISESELDNTEPLSESKKNFLEYEENDETGVKSLAVRSVDTDATILQKDIRIAGLQGVLGSGKYKNGDTIPKGTNIFDIFQNILCQELYPENVTEKKATATVSMNALTLKLNYNDNEVVEVGTLVKLLEGKTNDTECVTTDSIVSGMTNGYSFQDDDTAVSDDTEIIKKCTKNISNNTYTISATINNGFNADTKNYVKTVPATKNGNGSAQLTETNLGCAVEGENKITLNATGASYSYQAEAIDKVYYCSNLGNTDSNKFSTGITVTSGVTNKPTNSKTKKVIGKYRYYLGYSNNTSYKQFDSDVIKKLDVKTDWIVLDESENICTVIGEEKIKTDGKSVVFACPVKYRMESFDDGFGVSIMEKFTSQGTVKVKTGMIETDYMVYVYPITNNSVFEIKNITIK